MFADDTLRTRARRYVPVMSSVTDVADRIFAAIEAGDADAVTDVYADDVVIWHNDDGLEQTKEQNLRVLGWLVKLTTRREYCAVRRYEIEGGFVQQHDLHVDLSDGRSAILPACVIVQVDDGKITRIDEYLDSAAVTATFSPPT